MFVCSLTLTFLAVLLFPVGAQHCRYVPICDGAAPDSTGTPIKGDKGEVGSPGKRGPVGTVGPQGVAGPVKNIDEFSRNISNLLREQLNLLERQESDLNNTKTELLKLKELLVPSSCSTSWKNGIQTLKNGEEVFCSERWRVFQRRFDGTVPFHSKLWDEYAAGFGNLTGEFWLGLDKLHNLTTNSDCRLHVDVWDFKGGHAYAEYTKFAVGSPASFYRLSVLNFRGNAGDSLSHCNNMMFTTNDRDNDRYQPQNCAKHHGGPSWHINCCNARLNGNYQRSPAHNTISWYNWKNSWGGISASMMKIKCK